MYDKFFCAFLISIVQQLVIKMAGEINVESRVEHGSSFILKFPRLK